MSRERVSPTPMIDSLLSGRVGFSIEELAAAMGVSRDTIEREIQRECVDPRFAVACVEKDCGWIYDERNEACPKCGSKAALNVWKSLNGRSAA